MGVRGSCKLCDKQAKQKYRLNNKEKIVIAKKADYEANKDKYLANKKIYRQENKGKINALVAARKKVVKQRTPKWLTDIDFERIRNEYNLAVLQSKITGETWHVDHIIPLQGKIVSGLHVPSNLMAIRGSDNLLKNARKTVKTEGP